MKKSILFLILIIGGIILSQAVFADSPSIGLSPLTFELTGNPGDVIENSLKIGNPSEEHTISVKVTVEDIAPTGEAGHVVVKPAETETYSLAKWVKCEPYEFTLKPKEEKRIRFIISIPKNAEPGGHYGTVVAGSTGVVGPGMTGATIIPRVGALVLLTVPGEMKENLVVKDFSAPNFSEYGPINFVTRFENRGTVHVRPVGLVTITDWRGRKVTDLSFPQKNVLPGGVRKFETVWPGKWHLGKYTATLSGSYGLSNTPFSPVILTFWVIPWKIILGISLGLAILAIFLFITRKRWKLALRILLKGENV